MSIEYAALDGLLTPLGFQYSAGFAEANGLSIGGRSGSYELQIVGPFWICTRVRSGHDGNIDFALARGPSDWMIGTVHRVWSLLAVTTHATKIIGDLTALAATPELLICPSCKKRDVRLQEQVSQGGKQYAPFLSCRGMTTGTGRGAGRVACRGTSKKIPPLLHYR